MAGVAAFTLKATREANCRYEALSLRGTAAIKEMVSAPANVLLLAAVETAATDEEEEDGEEEEDEEEEEEEDDEEEVDAEEEDEEEEEDEAKPKVSRAISISALSCTIC